MRKLALAGPLSLLLAGVASAQQAGVLPADQAAMKAHVAFLAADSMKGRLAGSPEYDIAADYVAAQMEAAGLVPAGANGTWRQSVPLVAARPLQSTATIATTARAGTGEVLKLGTDYVGRASVSQAERTVSGALVFAGYGVVDPTRGIDDYRGLDVRGKIVAVLYGVPQGLNSEVGAHYGNRDVKAQLAGERGAAGVVFIEARSTRDSYAFDKIVESWSGPSMNWAPPEGAVEPERAPQLAAISETGAARLFAGSKLNWARVRAADQAKRPVPTGALATSMTIAQTSEIVRTASPNVIGKLPGSDPTLAAEHVVLTSHLDHIGVGDEVNGDAINNGAMDNAMGIAAMIEVARSFRASGAAPRRSILFVAVTAEEAGLIGSDYYARYPTVARDSMVANVNLDMPIMTYAFRDIVAYGADRSSIGPVLAEVAKAQGLTLTPDPTPDEAFFVRTDHYSFVKQGVPAVSIDAGPAGPGAKATAEFIDKHYHQPSDDMKLPFDWASARRFVALNYELTRRLADGERPRWNPGDFFGTLYAR